MAKKYIQAGSQAGDLYDTVNELSGMQSDGSQGEASMGKNKAITVDASGNITLRSNDGVTKGTIENSTKLNNQPASYYATAANAFATYQHEFRNGAHELTGTGDNIKFVAKANYNGEQIKVNGTPCTCKTISGDTIWTGFFASGSVVTCYKNGTTLNFNSGGLPKSETSKLTPENIKAGVSVKINGHDVRGNFTADANAQNQDIISGKSGYVNGRKIVGSLPDQTPSVTIEERASYGGGTRGDGLYLKIPVGAYRAKSDWHTMIPQNMLIHVLGINANKVAAGSSIAGVQGNYYGELLGVYFGGGQGNYNSKRGALFAQGFGGLSGGPIFEWFEWYRHQGKTLTTATFTSNFTGNIRADVQYTRVGDGQATVTIKKNGSPVSGTFSVRPRDTITISGHIQDNNTDGSETGGSVRVTLRRA